MSPSVNSFFTDPTVEQMEMIKEKFGEDEARFKNNIILLQEWMDKHPNMPKNYDKRLLPNYLRACKHDMEKTKKKLEYFFIMKALAPQLNVVPDLESEEVKEVFKNFKLVPCKKLTPDGYRIKISYFTSKDDSRFNADVLFQYMVAAINLYNVEDGLKMGDIYVCHQESLKLSTIAKLMTPNMVKILKLWQEGLADIISGIYVINANEVLRKFIAFAKMFVSEKVRNRIHFCKNIEELKNFISTDVLPKDYGGNEAPFEELHQEFLDFVKSRKQYLKEQESITFIGTVPNKIEISSDNMFGTEGSFRTLSID